MSWAQPADSEYMTRSDCSTSRLTFDDWSRSSSGRAIHQRRMVRRRLVVMEQGALDLHVSSALRVIGTVGRPRRAKASSFCQGLSDRRRPRRRSSRSAQISWLRARAAIT
jgi:hypothetical protein